MEKTCLSHLHKLYYDCDHLGNVRQVTKAAVQVQFKDPDGKEENSFVPF